MEPNAFIELTQRPSSCEASVCTCPDGRSHNATEPADAMALMNCCVCGSHCVHRACCSDNEFTCGECAEILNRDTSAIEIISSDEEDELEPHGVQKEGSESSDSGVGSTRTNQSNDEHSNASDAEPKSLDRNANESDALTKEAIEKNASPSSANSSFLFDCAVSDIEDECVEVMKPIGKSKRKRLTDSESTDEDQFYAMHCSAHLKRGRFHLLNSDEEA